MLLHKNYVHVFVNIYIIVKRALTNNKNFPHFVFNNLHVQIQVGTGFIVAVGGGGGVIGVDVFVGLFVRPDT